MLSLLAASLPFHTSPEARLLALQCVLRCEAGGALALPRGLIRGMRLGDAEPLWREMLDARWLRSAAPTALGMRVQLNDPLPGLPGRGLRAQAAHWALVASHGPSIQHASSTSRLAIVTLQAHTQPAHFKGLGDSHTLARMCGTSQHQLLVTAQGLLDSGVLQNCSLVNGEDLAWNWPGTGPFEETGTSGDERPRPDREI
ncbi:hypothetical protein ACFYOG_32755 [Streptomyces sp. NPDC007818]|uniref:hypothetical protein n=1 Tax=Streptomyces sp. NPDC007818 TaxID=3364780 RepID=UPI0036854D0B